MAVAHAEQFDKLIQVANGMLALEAGLYRFTQDYSFSSPSTAAAVVLGRSANGHIEWKELQEAELT